MEFFVKKSEVGVKWRIKSRYLFTAKKAYERKDYPKTLRYFQKAADMGNVLACYNLGSMYRKSLGVDQDYSKTLQYFQKATYGKCYGSS
ncbi:tetratricopeptide repeat protein [Helicobacter bizzozeronii]|uniref:tetratricopeptide repeat protein n=1 Tax=Helicobacter bizzozeronii TaxID=56877 RepID=UPI000CF02C18